MRIEPALREALQAVADERNQSLGSFIEKICRDWIAAQPKRKRAGG